MTDKPTPSGATKIRGKWYARIRLPNGDRRRFALPAGISEARAHDMANAMRERVQANPEKYTVQPGKKSHAAKPGELTVEDYATGWIEDRERRGLSSIKTDRARLKNHVIPIIGGTAMVKVTKEDVRRVVEALDAKATAGTFSASTAVKVWGLVSKMFSDSCEAKVAALRVRVDNPADGVRGPDRPQKRAKQWLYPREVEKLLACAEVPLRWLRLYALAAYLYLRPGELAALEWRDVDLERGAISVRRALDLREDKIKGLKTSRSGVNRRTVPIPKALLPLLHVLHQDAGGSGRVVQHTHANKDMAHGMPPLEDLAATLREHLQRAGVDRHELHHDDEGSHRIVFYSLRDTGITWEALAGTDHVRIMQRAGHTNFKTTLGYTHAVEDLQLGDGELPFPTLPDSFLVGHGWATKRPTPLQVSETVSEKRRPQRDSNPCYSLERAVSWAGLDDGDRQGRLT